VCVKGAVGARFEPTEDIGRMHLVEVTGTALIVGSRHVTSERRRARAGVLDAPGLVATGHRCQGTKKQGLSPTSKTENSSISPAPPTSPAPGRIRDFPIPAVITGG
jgi:hypothetical protein